MVGPILRVGSEVCPWFEKVDDYWLRAQFPLFITRKAHFSVALRALLGLIIFCLTGLNSQREETWRAAWICTGDLLGRQWRYANSSLKHRLLVSEDRGLWPGVRRGKPVPESRGTVAKNNLGEQQWYSQHLRRWILVQRQAQQVRWKEMQKLVVCVFLDSLTLKEAVIYVQSWGKPLLETRKLGHFHCQSICCFKKQHFAFLWELWSSAPKETKAQTSFTDQYLPEISL